MIFTCRKCRYTFNIDEQPKRCPDCGAITVRIAIPAEENEYRKNRKLYEDE